MSETRRHCSCLRNPSVTEAAVTERFVPLAFRGQRGARRRRPRRGEPLHFGAETPNVHFKLKRGPTLSTSHGQGSLLCRGGKGGRESEAMGLSAKMKQWPHPTFPDSSILPVPGRGRCRSRQGCPHVNGTPVRQDSHTESRPSRPSLVLVQGGRHSASSSCQAQDCLKHWSKLF